MAYANTKKHTDVSGSNSGELILVVYERIFDNLKQGQREFALGNWGIQPLTTASELIDLGLLGCLDYAKGGEVAENLAVIYGWCLKTILQARVNKSVEKIQEVIDVLTPIHEGWLTLIPAKLERGPNQYPQAVNL